MTYLDDEIVDTQIQLQANVYLNHMLTNNGTANDIRNAREATVYRNKPYRKATAVETQNDGAASNE